jgi:hypothetical protein
LELELELGWGHRLAQELVGLLGVEWELEKGLVLAHVLAQVLVLVLELVLERMLGAHLAVEWEHRLELEMVKA